MNTVNGKPIGGMETYGERVGVSRGFREGKPIVDMTFSELEALWKKVRPDGRRNNRK